MLMIAVRGTNQQRAILCVHQLVLGAASMTKVHPQSLEMNSEEERCSPDCHKCCVRLVVWLCAWMFLGVLAVLVSLPHMLRAFDALTDFERVRLSIWLGGGWIAFTCFLCCACCCVVCCCTDDPEDQPKSLRRSSLAISWAAQRFDDAHARQLAALTRRLSTSVAIGQHELSTRVSSLRTSTTASLRVSNLH